MSKILVKFLKGHELFVPDDVTSIEKSEYLELRKRGVVEKTTLLEMDTECKDDYEKDELRGQNLLGKRYKKGFMDVVVLTKNKKKLSELRGLSDNNKVSLTVIERVFNEENGGFAQACNEGAKLNKGLGEFILFLNDDVEIGDNFFKDIIKPFSDSKVGMVGTQCSETGWGLNGSVMCIRRELFENIGGFDETFFFMFEDNDLCENVKRRGFRIEISEAVAKHEGNDSVNNGSEFWRVNYYNGENYFREKWMNKQRIIGSMIVGDENNRYMSRVIMDLFKRDLIDEMVVVCDKSNKETVEELRVLKFYYPITIHYHDFKLFGIDEGRLRERACSYAISKNPYGIIPIDADEFFDEEMNRDTFITLLNKGVAWDFVLAHFWGDEKSVRIDGVFAHQKNVRLFRYTPYSSQRFYDKNLHCGSVPIYAYEKRKDTDFILKHFGYINKKDVLSKKKRQEQFDKNMTLENPDLYKRMMKDGDTMEFNKVKFLNIWKK